MVNFSCVAFYPNGKCEVISSKSKFDWTYRTNEKLPIDGDDQHVIKEACLTFHASNNNETINAVSMSYFLIDQVTMKSDSEIRLPFARSGCNNHPLILFFPSKAKYRCKSIFIPSNGYEGVVDCWSVRSFGKTFNIHLRQNPSTPVPKYAFVLFADEDNKVNLKAKSIDSFESLHVDCDYLHLVYAYDTSESNWVEENETVDFISDKEIRYASTQSNLTLTERMSHWTTKKLVRFIFNTIGIIYISEDFVLRE